MSGPRHRVLRAKVHSAVVQDRSAVPLLLDGADEQFPCVGHVWMEQGYAGGGEDWIERELRWAIEVVQHPPKPRNKWVPLGTGDDPRPFERRLPFERSGFRGVLPRR